MISRNVSDASAPSHKLLAFLQKQWNGLKQSAQANRNEGLLVPVEDLEDRVLLSAIFPAYVNGVFTFGDPSNPAPYGLENTFFLSSNPTATKTIYLDFTGFHSVNNAWGHDIVFDPFDRDGDPTTFSEAELIEIQRQFQNVAEDYYPFDVNVTTMEPDVEDLINRGGGDTRWGIRSLATQPKDGFGNGIGGVAFLNSFSWNSDTPAFTFNKGINNGAMTHSHEVGHTLGLRHDGLPGQSYHPGVGTGPTSWGPIMGAPFGRSLTQWSRGEYQGANNLENDIQIITTNHGFGFRPDDHGDTAATASDMTIQNETDASAWGFIGRQTDIDFFKFSTGTGQVDFAIEPFQGFGNLDILAKLYDSSGNLIAESNPVDDINASFSLELAAGVYYLSIEGTGKPGVYTDYGSLGFYSIVGTIPGGGPVDPSVYLVGESGYIDLSSDWITVTLNGFYVDPVIIASLNSINDGQPATLRIRNVTSNSFDIQVDNWDYLPITHGFESVNYLVVEAGIHTLDNGIRIVAGNSVVNHEWAQVNFVESLSSTPVVLSQTVTRIGGSAVVTRMDQVTIQGFKLRLQEEEAADQRHSFETVSWIAFETGVSVFGTKNIDIDFVEDVTHNPKKFQFNRTFDALPGVFAAMQTFRGNNTANTRFVSYTNESGFVFIEEEQSLDEEVGHVPERIGYVAIDLGDIIGVRGVGEIGEIADLNHQWRVVNLEQTYLNPVVVAGLVTYNDNDPVTVRIRNVTSNSFEIRLQDWGYFDSFHAPERVGYMVFEAGVHKLADGTIIVANNETVNHNWKTIEYGLGFSDAPIVFSQMASEVGPASATTRMKDVGNKSFSVRLQEEELADQIHSFERVSWVAMQTGSSASPIQSFLSLFYDGVSSEETEIEFAPGLFSQRPVVFGNMQTFRDSDPATLRLTSRGVSNTSMFVFVEEETSWDKETDHDVEAVGIFAIGSTGFVKGTTTQRFRTVIDIDGLQASPQSDFGFSSVPFDVRFAVVPRITFIQNGPVIEETAFPFAYGHHDHDDDDDHDHERIGMNNVAFAVLNQSQVSNKQVAENVAIAPASVKPLSSLFSANEMENSVIRLGGNEHKGLDKTDRVITLTRIFDEKPEESFVLDQIDNEIFKLKLSAL
ncbi:MAG TPA: hypothetical protein PKD64_05460 [Pirellulaceae bacterium]|nr:hypothetical protein [Pirellulaceae bacterium]HMO91625.1 hypothetical protein [Pirellulaceae bacterium]HMP68322.1 hypothetical protein [Pirellulaceae bacterium]